MSRPTHTRQPQGRAAIEVSKMQNLADAISSAHPLNNLIDLVMDQISDVVPFDSAAVWLHDRQNGMWYIGGQRRLSWRAAQVRFKSSQALQSKIGDSGEIISNLNAAGFRRLYPEHKLIESALYAPMSISGKRVGLIALYGNTPDNFTPDDLRFVRTVGAQMGTAISFAALEARAERLAVLEERARLGANLHDGVLQVLSSIKIYSKELREALGALDGRAEGHVRAGLEALDELEQCVEDGSNEITAAIDHLRKPNLRLDVVRNLQLTRERLQNAGVSTELIVEVEDIAPDVSDALAWIAREAATNILRHSQARNVTVELRATGPIVEFLVSDDGVGQNGSRVNDADHLGQQIMRERAAQLGGTLELESDDRGTTIHVRVPVVPPLPEH